MQKIGASGGVLQVNFQSKKKWFFFQIFILQNIYFSNNCDALALRAKLPHQFIKSQAATEFQESSLYWHDRRVINWQLNLTHKGCWNRN